MVRELGLSDLETTRCTRRVGRLRYEARRDPRDAAVVELLLQTGMRLSDLAGLRLEALALTPEGVSTVVVGQGRRRRRIRLKLVRRPATR